MWSAAQVNERNGPKELMVVLGMNETVDQLFIANSVHWYGYVLGRKAVHEVSRALDIEVEGKTKKWGLIMM